MASFTVTDLATTPPAVTVAVFGSADPSTVQFFRLSESGAFVDSGVSAFGVGGWTDTVELPSGFYACVWSTLSDILPPVMVSVTTEPLAVMTRIRAAVKARILTIGMTGLTGGVVEQWTPDDNDVEYPCVILTHANTNQNNSQRVVGTSDIGQPVRVMICDRVSKYEHDAMPQYDKWRQQIWRAFDNQRLPGVSESLHCVIEPDLLMDPQGVHYELMVSQLLIRVTTREPAIGA